MKITSVESFAVSLPLAKPVRMSHGTIEQSDNVLVKITTDEGIVGWGEGVEAVNLTGVDQAGIKAAIDEIGTRIIGGNPLSRNRTWLDIREWMPSNTTAIGAIDIALHDIAGKAVGLPVSALIGGAARHEIPLLYLMGSGDPDHDHATFERLYESGARWLKLKLGIGDPDVEARTIAQLAASHRDVVVSGDANGAWDEPTTAAFMTALSGSHVRFIEQPTMQTEVLLRIAEDSEIAVCADESAKSHEAILGFRGTAIAGVSLKLIKHAGITGVMRAAALCDQLGMQINLSGKVAESAISTAANLHCAAAMSATGFGASPANHFLATDVCADPPRVVNGAYAVPTSPGLGIEVDEDAVRSLAS